MRTNLFYSSFHFAPLKSVLVHIWVKSHRLMVNPLTSFTVHSGQYENVKALS